MKDPCYSSIQTAITEADSFTAIRIEQGIYTEQISLNAAKNVTLQGGWDAAFDNQPGTTILGQAPKAPQGVLTIQDLRIISE